jgi:hypothetical protein
VTHSTLKKKDEFLSKGWGKKEFSFVEEKLFSTLGFHHKSLNLLFLIFLIVAFVLAFLSQLVFSSLWFVFSEPVFYISFVIVAWVSGMLYQWFVSTHSEFESHHHIFLLLSCLIVSYVSIFLVQGVYLLLDWRFTLGIEFFDVMVVGAVYSVVFTLPYMIHWVIMGFKEK